MFVHSVFFWLKKDLTEEQRRAFRRGLEGLKPIEAVQALYVGTPAATDRPIIDRSYSVALTVLFRDKAGCAAYEVHPLHKDFVRDFSSFWERIIVYDAE
jgi:hypothetical protein